MVIRSMSPPRSSSLSGKICPARIGIVSILDAGVANTTPALDEDGQVDFKGKAKAFTRTYAFISSILPFTNAEGLMESFF
jgi:hypothetical protein